MQKNIQQLGEYIQQSQKILLINHIRMDGDALGSLGGLYFILKKLGKNVKAINDEAIPEAFHFLNNTEIINPELDIANFQPDIIISLDVASPLQLGETYVKNKKVFDDIPFLVIDHHITNEGFGNLDIINVQSSSTCELLYNILEELQLTQYIDTKIATYLLMGVNTDTNVFYNSNTTAETFRVATELFQLGGDQRQIMNQLFKKKGLNQSKLWGEALSIITPAADGRIIGTKITISMFEKTQTTHRNTTGLLNEFLANIEGVKVSYLLYELPDGSIKGSLRGFTKDYNVSQIAQTFAGGGHVQAAGFTVTGKDINTVEQELIEELEKII